MGAAARSIEDRRGVYRQAEPAATHLARVVFSGAAQALLYLASISQQYMRDSESRPTPSEGRAIRAGRISRLAIAYRARSFYQKHYCRSYSTLCQILVASGLALRTLNHVNQGGGRVWGGGGRPRPVAKTATTPAAPHSQKTATTTRNTPPTTTPTPHQPPLSPPTPKTRFKGYDTTAAPLQKRGIIPINPRRNEDSPETGHQENRMPACGR